MLLVFVLTAALTGCGGSSPPATSPAPSAERDEIAGCWRDDGEGMVLCLEDRGYVLFLPDGKWDRVVVEWAKKTPLERSGRTRTPRPLWLDLRADRGALVMNDGQSETRLARPSDGERVTLAQKIARLPELAEVCDWAAQCRSKVLAALGEQSAGEHDLGSTRSCIGYLNAMAAVLRQSGQPVPPECGP